MPHDGSFANTSRNDRSVSIYLNECSIATDLCKSAWTVGEHEFLKSTFPSPWDECWPIAVTASNPENTELMKTFRILSPQHQRSSPFVGRSGAGKGSLARGFIAAYFITLRKRKDGRMSVKEKRDASHHPWVPEKDERTFHSSRESSIPFGKTSIT
jgi:hypothetical protein